MACVRLLDGREVMRREELLGHEEANFRRLALACGLDQLPESPGENSECLTAVVRQYVEVATGAAEGLGSCFDLLQAAERGNTQHVLELLEKPHDPNAAKRNRHVTPLHNAAENGHLAVAQFLLEVGANTEKANCDGFTPLHRAAQQGHRAVNACWKPVLIKRSRPTMVSHHCIALQ